MCMGVYGKKKTNELLHLYLKTKSIPKDFLENPPTLTKLSCCFAGLKLGMAHSLGGKLGCVECMKASLLLS